METIRIHFCHTQRNKYQIYLWIFFEDRIGNYMAQNQIERGPKNLPFEIVRSHARLFPFFSQDVPTNKQSLIKKTQLLLLLQYRY